MNSKKIQLADLETQFKGFASLNRIKILLLLEEHRYLSVSNLCSLLNSDIKNVSEHILKIKKAKLVTRYREVYPYPYTLTPLGLTIVDFIQNRNTHL